MKQLHITFIGDSPLIMHSPKCVNPLHPIAIRMKEFTSKRKKTEEDLLAISDLEWEAGVYWDDAVGLHIPNECIKATIQNGAKQNKKGKDIAKYLQVVTLMAPLNIGEEQDYAHLKSDIRYRDVRSVCVQRSRVNRTRPRFNTWSTEFDVVYDETMLDLATIVAALEYWALSPLKEENTPSFSVRREEGTFYDFSSGIGGNVLTFVRYYDKCGYREAIEKLKKYSGYDGTTVCRKRLAAAEVAKRFAPPKKAPNRAKPTVLSDDYMERYERRADKLAVWEQEGISKPSLERFQVRYDSFSNRLVYPIRNPDGKIVNVGGRTLDEDWKEKKLRKYTYFMPWGEMKTIYGLSENLDAIKKQGEIILFEGCKSVLLADTWGIRNAGAILTSHLNPNQMKLLIGLGCRVVFALDKDVSIRDDHNISRLKQFVNVEYIWDDAGLLGEKDSPVDKGPDVWKKLYERRLSWR